MCSLVILSGVGVQDGPEADAGLDPEVGSVQHLLPQGHLLPHRVHPARRSARMFS